jgi:chemotaxis family two-component system sensor kinase Cph1
MLQLFQNLISNAIKFKSENPHHIGISANKNEDKYVFSVKDNGIGIDPNTKNKYLKFSKSYIQLMNTLVRE